MVRCDVAGYGVVRAGPDALAALRKDPGPVPGGPLPASLLKHADGQTVVALAAVLRAIAEHGLAATPFADWGAVAAARFLGRVACAAALHRFGKEGAWGVSPHLIPHHSSHAVSGTLSLALRSHGPNFAAGGGPDGAGDAFLTAAALLAEENLPGVWVVLAGWDPEPVPDREGRLESLGTCNGLALALVPPRDGGAGLRLSVGPASGADGLTLDALLAAVTGREPVGAWQVGGGVGLRLERVGGGMGEAAS